MRPPYHLHDMTNTHLLETVKAFQHIERHEAALFLASPFFNRGNNAQLLIRLLEFVLQAAPDFPETALQKEDAYRFVFADSTFVPGKIEKLMTELNKLLRLFVITRRYLSTENATSQQIEWTAWLRENNLLERGRQNMEKLMTQQTSQKNSESLEFYHAKLMVFKEAHEWESIQNQVKGNLGVPALIEQLDLYYLNYRTELENRYLLQQKGAQLPNLDWNSLNPDYYIGKSVLLQISAKINSLLRSEVPSEEDFQYLMQLLQTQENFLSFQTLSHCYAFVRSACTTLINSGQLKFIPVLHRIHLDNIGRGYFFINNEISPNAYVNLVQIAIRAKDIDWAIAFTEEYQDKIIGGDERHFFYNFNMAHCRFAQGWFEEALNRMPDASSHSHYLHIIRRLEVKIYYELRSELLTYKMDSFRKFIERTASRTIANSLREMDLNFFNILNQLVNAPLKSKSHAERILERIEKKRLLSDRTWLIEKAQELE